MKRSFRAEGDFAEGTSLGDVLKGMTVRDTIVQLLDSHAEKINLKHLSQYADKPSRDDLMIFKTRDSSFVRFLDLSDLEVTDSDMDGVSALKLAHLGAVNDQLKNLHALKDMQSLTSLDLSGCPIDKQGVDVLVGLKSLSALHLDRAPIDDKDLEKLAQLKMLAYLAISSCPNLTPQAVHKFESEHPKCIVIARRSANESGFSDIMRVSASLISDGEYDEADTSLQGLIKKWQTYKPVPYPWIIRAYRYRGRCQASSKRLELACHMYEKALQLCQEHAPDTPEKPDVMADYGEALEQLGQLSEATKLRKSADQLWKKHLSESAASLSYQANAAWLAKHR